MKPEEQIKIHLEESRKIIDSALSYVLHDDIGVAADAIDIAIDKLMQAYAIAREYSDYE